MLYFAYGANMDARTMTETVPEARLVGPGRIEGYGIGFTVYSDRWEGGAANIEPTDNAHTWGIVWDVPPEEIPKLDTYVGHPTFYRQEHLEVRMGPRVDQCFTYRVAHQKGYIRPTDAYLNHVRAAMRQGGLPPEALDQFDHAARPPGPSIG